MNRRQRAPLLVAPVLLVAPLLLGRPGAVAARQVDPACATERMDVLSFVERCGALLGSIARLTDPAARDSAIARIRDGMQTALEELADPRTLNTALGFARTDPSLKALLEPLQLDFVELQASGDEGVLGLRYDWSKDLLGKALSEGATRTGLHFATKARGTVALESAANPESFEELSGVLSLFRSSGGVVGAAEMGTWLNQLDDEAARYETFEELARSDVYAALMGAVWERLTTQVYVTLDGRMAYEGDQGFDRDQWAYGARVGLDVKAWNPDSRLARLNVFDWPAALLRVLLGADDDFAPSGAAFPTFLAGIDQVDPGENPERRALGALDGYGRLFVELAYRSPLGRARGRTTFLEVGYRAYRELGASDAVRAASLDRTERFFVALTGPAGLTVSWAKGRVPFDTTNDDVFALGFRVTF